MDDHGDESRIPDPVDAPRGQPPEDPDAAFPDERVRIIGADEARAAIERGQPVARAGADNGDARFAEMRFSPSSRLGGSSFAAEDLADDQNGEREGSGDDARTTRDIAPPPPRIVGADERVNQARLPHWTEPPTGQLPRIFAGEPEIDADAEAEAWSQVGTSARYRDLSGDWAGPDFLPDELRKDDQPLGALAEASYDDDDDTFAREVEERRAKGGRAARARGEAEAGAPDPEVAEDPNLADSEVRSDVEGGFAPPLRAPLDPAPGTRGDRGGDYEFGPPEFRGQPDRPDDLMLRIVAAVVLGAIALLCFSLGRGWTVALVTLVVALACSEFYAGARPQGYRPATLLGILGAASLAPIAYKRGTEAFPLVIAIVLVFTMLWFLTGAVRARPVANLGLTMLGFGYIGFLGGFAGLLLAHPDGTHLIVGVVLCVVANDIVAYAVGRRFGRTPLAPHISPTKTWAGAIAGFVASVVVSAVVVHQISPWDNSTANSLWLGIVLGVAAPIGDLCESMIKRDLGLKDFGGLLPGHGGFLDRFDALLFAMPFAYYLVRVLNM